MKSRIILLAAAAGLACGLLVRPQFTPAAAADSPSQSGGLGSPLNPDGNPSSAAAAAAQAAASWEARLSPYLTNPLPPPVARNLGGPRGETAAFLRMARLPVSQASIDEGVALLNATGSSRYLPVISAVFERWAREAPEAALAATGRLRDAKTRMALAWKVFETAAATSGDPGLTAKAAALPPGIIRSAAFAAITDSLPPDRVADMLRQSLTGKPPTYMAGESFQQQLLTKLAQTDQAAPLRFALETEDPAWRAGLLQAALLMSPDAPPDTLSKLARDPRNVEGLMYHMANALRYDTADALKMITDWPEANRQQLLLKTFGSAFERLPEARPVMSPENLDILVTETRRQAGDEGLQKILTEAALARGPQGLEETAVWMRSRHDSDELADLIRRATATAPFTTARWLAAMPPSPDRDTAVSIFAQTHAATDPERAAAWPNPSPTPPNAKPRCALCTGSDPPNPPQPDLIQTPEQSLLGTAWGHFLKKCPHPLPTMTSPHANHDLIPLKA